MRLQPKPVERTIQTVRIKASPGSIAVEPDPAYAQVGNSIEWKFEFSGESSGYITLKIEFLDGSPFPWLRREICVERGKVTNDPYVTGDACNTGDFKYSVRVSDVDTRQVLADEDPRIVVSP